MINEHHQFHPAVFTSDKIYYLRLKSMFCLQNVTDILNHCQSRPTPCTVFKADKLSQ